MSVYLHLWGLAWWVACPCEKRTMSWVDLGRVTVDSRRHGTASEDRGDTLGRRPCVWGVGVEDWRESWLLSPYLLPTFLTNRALFCLERQCDSENTPISLPCIQDWPVNGQWDKSQSSQGVLSGRCFLFVLFVIISLFMGTLSWHMPLTLWPFSFLECRQNARSSSHVWTIRQ